MTTIIMKHTSTKKKDIIKLAISLAVIVFVNYAAGFINIKIDLTKDKKYSLSPVSKEILKNLDAKVSIKVYLDGKLSIPYKKFSRSIEDKLEEFKVYGKDRLSYTFIDPLKDTIFRELQQKKLNPVNYSYKNRQGDLTIATIVPGALISYRGREVPVNLLKDGPVSDEEKVNSSLELLEYKFINMIRKITNDSPDTIGFIIGHGELYGYELEDIYSELEDCYKIDKVVMINGQAGILDKYKSIIIAKPKYRFSEADKFVIDQYIMNGGKVLWLIDAVSVGNVDSLLIKGYIKTSINNLNIEDQLFRYGIRINPVLVKDKVCTILPINVASLNQVADWAPFDWPYFPMLIPAPDHLVTKNSSYIRSQFANTIDTLGSRKTVKKTILLKTSKNNKLVMAPPIISKEEIFYDEPASAFDTVSKPVAVLLEGTFESDFNNRPVPENLIHGEKKIPFRDKSANTKMIVVADGDVIRNDFIVLTDGVIILPLKTDKYIEFINYYGKEELPSFFDNKDFMVDAINYLTNTRGITELRNREYELRLLDEVKTGSLKNRIKWQLINTLMPVLIIIAFGLLYNYLRKRKYTSASILNP
jgi:ABC-2 type transport system permease protein